MKKLINLYYLEFESYNELFSNNRLLLVIIFTLAIAFFISILNILGVFGFRDYTESAKFSSIGGSLLIELILIGCFQGIRDIRDERIIKKYKKIFKKENMTLNYAKKLWFQKTLDILPSEFLNLAEKIDKYVQLENKYNSNFKRNNFLELIFANESKNRVLAMILSVVALTTALLISSGTSIDIIFSMVDYGLGKLFIFLLLVSLIIFLGFYVLRYGFILIIQLYDFIMDNSLYNKKISLRKKKIFISELLRQYELPKQRYRLPAILGEEKQD